MQFQDELAGGVVLVRPALQSPDYETGVSGWAIKIDGSAEFNDVVIRGGTTTQGKVFVYNGTPALGNLILSISPTAGTDSFGNNFPQGQGMYGSSGTITMYDGSGVEQMRLTGTSGVQLNGPDGDGSQLRPDGVLLLGDDAYTVPASVFANAGGLDIVSPSNTSGTTDAPTRLILTPGDGDGSPHATATLGVTTSSTDTDLTVAGFITVDPFDTTGGAITLNSGYVRRAETWQAPSYNANWAGTGTFNGLSTFTDLQYRIDAEDNVWLYGCFEATGAVGSDVFALPAAFRPVDRAMVPVNFFDSSAAQVDGRFLQVLTNGNVSISANSAGTSPASGDQFFVNGKFPLGHIS